MKRYMIAMLIFILLFSNLNLLTLPSTSTKSLSTDSGSIQELDQLKNVQKSQILENINTLDGFFTTNNGQVGDESVKYYIQGKGVWFLDDGVVFEITESSPVGSPESSNRESIDSLDRPHPMFEPEMPEPIKSVAIKLNFEGCNEVEPKGIGQLTRFLMLSL